MFVCVYLCVYVLACLLSSKLLKVYFNLQSIAENIDAASNSKIFLASIFLESHL